MPVAPTYPGVYIEEVPSGVRTIAGVATSIAAFLGYFKRGPMDKAVHIFNFGDFEREFGGIDTDSEASYAIQQFFLNGGTEAYIMRAAGAGTAEEAAIAAKESSTAANPILRITAANAGAWGNNLRIDVDYSTTDPAATFNLTVTEMVNVGGKLQPGNSETFRNLILDSTLVNDAKKVINDGSTLIQVEYMNSPTSAIRPAQTGTLSKVIAPADVSGLVNTDAMDVSLNGGPSVGTVTLGDPVPTTVAALASTLTTKLRAISGLGKATVNLIGSTSTQVSLQVKTGTATDATTNDVASFSGTLATKLGLNSAARSNVQQYVLGATAKAAQALPNGGAQVGDDGDPPGATELIGNQSSKTGMFMLEDVDLFNILCIPDTMNLADTGAAQVIAAAETYAEQRRSFYVVDVPQFDQVRDKIDEIQTWLDANGTLRHKNAALYYPRPMIADPLNDFRLKASAPSGLLAGLYARTDAERGVWKAPAGTDAALRGVQALEYALTDPENGTLNPLAINCLRRFPIYGNVSWGARTLVGADAQASEWKYIPVRRLALFLEESLYRGTKWVVFEPNDEPLWAQIRLNVGAFMHDLFRQGAFQGSTPRDAYFVKCDAETTTQSDINRGIVNIHVGFAPLKPAEFVIIKIQQMAGQIDVG